MSDHLIQFLDKFKLPLALSLVGIVLIIGGLLIGSSNREPKVFPKESLVESRQVIRVDVSGAVNKPGVYQLKEGSRIEDAISAASGFAQDAQSEYIAKVLNLAQRLVDGSKIYIPRIGESINEQIGTVSSIIAGTKININSASASELDSLPGVGEATTRKIISGRPYQTIEELLSKKVVTKAVFDKIKDQLVVY